MGMTNARPGDFVELADKEGGFSDFETGFDISRDQKVRLGDSIGKRTHEALVSGGLLVVSSKASKSKGETTDDANELPEDLPGRDVFAAAGLNFDQVKALDEDALKAMKGIGAKTVEALKAYAAKG